MRQEHGRDADVVIDYLAFGETGLRVQDLVQVRDRELFSFDGELGFVGHGSQRSTSNVQRSTSNSETIR